METPLKIDPATVRKLREAKAWSQEHLAGAAGLSTRTVQRVEAEGAAAAETLLALAAALGVTPAELRPAAVAADAEDLTRGLRFGKAGLWGGLTCALIAIAAGYATGDLSAADAGVATGIVAGITGLSAALMGVVVGWARTRAPTG
jgi:transcriptional regulator with XRE-family HTH domain